MIKLKGLWWVLTCKKKFRVFYPKIGQYTTLMTYMEADGLASIYEGTVCIDTTKY